MNIVVDQARGEFGKITSDQSTITEEAKKEAYLKLKGFNVVGSMENPPTNPDAVKVAGATA